MDLEAVVAQLRADVDVLTEVMQELVRQVQRSDSPEGKPNQWTWRHLPEDAAAGLWARLRDFVDWLNSRYALDSERQIPACWYRHPVAVEELTALLCSWQSVYCGQDVASDALLAWHAHSLWPCVDRLPERSGWQRCRGGEHVQRASTIYRTDGGFDTFITAR